MPGVVDICNLALANLGDEATVSSIYPPEGSVQAEHCARFYPIAVKSILELHDWGFATHRTPLTLYEDEENPRIGVWKYCYALPSDCLRIISVDPPGLRKQSAPEYAKGYYDYEIGINDDGLQCLYTNIENAVMKYVATTNIRDQFFPYNFLMAVAWKLSAMLAGPMIKGDTGAQMAQSCEKMAQYWFELAKSVDAQQHRDYSEVVPEWITRR